VLPKVIVTDSRDLTPPESWRYASAPGFEILSSAPDQAAAKAIGDFQTFNLALGIVWPVPRVHGAAPLPLILCGRRGEFARLAPASAGPASASVFLKDGERAAILVDLRATVVDVSTPEDDARNAAAGNLSGGMRVDSSQQLRREYVHYLWARAEPRPPAWLEEGLSQLFMGMTYDRTRISLAKVGDPDRVSNGEAMRALSAPLDAAAGVSTGGAAGGGPSTVPVASVQKEDDTFNVALRHRALVPLPELFAVAHDSATALNSLGSGWAKECYAFVHLCLYGEGYRYQKGFRRFISQPNDPPSEKFFQECFGEGYGPMLAELRGYIDGTRYKPVEFDVKKGGPGLPEPTPLAWRDATQSEIGRLTGEALLLAGRRDEARLALNASYLRGERDPRLLAELGVLTSADGDGARAGRILEAAAAAKSTDPRVYLELARLRLARFESKPGGDGRRLSAGQQADVLTVLFMARSLPPALPEVYESMAETWDRSAVRPTPENLAVLEEGVALFPRRVALIYRTATLEAVVGAKANAAALAALGLKVTAAGTPEHSRFARLAQP
jgi:hypothetical protein